MNGGQTPDELVAMRTTKLSSQLKEYENLLTSPLPDPTTVYIGDGYFASMPKEKAQEFIKRKIELINEELSTLYQLNGVNEDGLPVFDIVEELDDNDEVITSKMNRTGLSAELANLKEANSPRISEVPSETPKAAGSTASDSVDAKSVAEKNLVGEKSASGSTTPGPKASGPASGSTGSKAGSKAGSKSASSKPASSKSAGSRPISSSGSKNTDSKSVDANSSGANSKSVDPNSSGVNSKSVDPNSSGADSKSVKPAVIPSPTVPIERDLGPQDIERFEEDKSGGDFRDIDPSDILELQLEDDSDDNDIEFNFDELEIDDDAYEFHEGDSDSDSDDDDDDEDNQTDYNFGWGSGGLFPNNESTLKAIEAHLAQQKRDELKSDDPSSNDANSNLTNNDEANRNKSAELTSEDSGNKQSKEATKSSIRSQKDGAASKNAHVRFAENIDVREFETNSNERKNTSLEFYSSPSLSRFKSLRQSASRNQPLAGPNVGISNNSNAGAAGAAAGAAAAAVAASKSSPSKGPKAVHGGIIEREPVASPPKKVIHHIRPVPRATLKQQTVRTPTKKTATPQPTEQPQHPQQSQQPQKQQVPPQVQQSQKPQQSQEPHQPHQVQSHPVQSHQVHPQKSQVPHQGQQSHPQKPQQSQAHLHHPQHQPQQSQKPTASFLRKPTVQHHTITRQAKPAQVRQPVTVQEPAPEPTEKPSLKEKVAADAQRIFDESFVPDVEFLKLHDKESEDVKLPDPAKPAKTAEPINDKPILSGVIEKEDDEILEEDDSPDENAVNMTEIKQEYQRLRQQLIYESGGFKKKDSEKEIEPIDDSGAPKKVSRFKAARIS